MLNYIQTQKTYKIVFILWTFYVLKLSFNYILDNQDTFFLTYLTLPIFLMIGNLFIANWNPLNIGFFVLINIFLSNFIFYKSKDLYYWINSLGWFNLPQTKFLQTSNDYIFVLMYLLLLGINFCLILNRNILKKRSRLFIFLGAGAIAFTSAIFHYITVDQYFLKSKKDEMVLMKKIINDETPIFLHECEQLDFNCVIGINSIPQKPELSFLKDWQIKSHNQYFIGAFGQSKEDIYYYLYDKKQEHFIIDQERPRISFANAENWLHFLSFFAHTFWINFMFFLILFHERKKWTQDKFKFT